MRNILYILLFLSCVFSFTQTQAFTLEFWEELDITNTIQDDLYSAGWRTDISAEILGDAILAGGEINIDAKISQDAILAGGDIVISEEIWDDVRVMAWNIRIEADILGDLIVLGWDVKLDSDAKVHWDVVAFAGQVTLDWNVWGDLRMMWWKLSINGIIEWNADIEVELFKTSSGSWSILWELSYSSYKKMQELESIAKSGINFELQEEDDLEETLFWIAIGYYFYKLLGVFILSCVLYFFFEKIAHKVWNNLKTKTWKSFLYWFLLIVGTPVVILLLTVSIIGIPFALFTMFLYIFLFVFAKLMNVIVMTAFVSDKFDITVLWGKVALIFGLSFLFCTLGIISMLVAIFVFGALALYKIEVIQNLRK